MNSVKTIIIGFLAGLAGAFVFFQYNQKNYNNSLRKESIVVSNLPSHETYQTAVTPPSTISSDNTLDFSYAAAKTTPSVVYINSISQTGVSYSYFDLLFGNGGQQTQVS